VKTSRF